MRASLDHLPRIYYLLMGLVLALVLAFIFFRADELDQHNRSVTLLSQLKQLDAQLSEDLLLVHAFHLNHFDSISATRKSIERLNHQLTSPKWDLLGAYGEPFREAAQHYLQGSSEKLKRLERIKSLAAVFGNSLRYLPTAVMHFSAQLDDERAQALMRLSATLLNYSIFTEDEYRLSLEEQIDELDKDHWQPEQRKTLDNLLQHTRFSLEKGAQLTEQIDYYLNLDTSRRIDSLSSAYLDHYAQVTRNSERLALFLSLLVLLLFIGLGLAMRSLQSARRRAERTWEQLKDAIESIGEGFALYGLDDRLLLWNRNFSRAFPRCRGGLKVGMSFRELLVENLDHGEYRLEQPREEWLEQHLRCEGRPLLEQMSDGRTFHMNNYPTAEGGRVTILTDITSRLSAEAELRKLSRAVEQSPVSVIITDIKGDIEYVNRKFIEVTGYAEQEVIGKNPRMLKGGDLSGDEYADLWKVIQRGEEWRGEFHNQRKDGELFWESASISAIRDANGEISSYLALKEDITERKAAEEQLHLAAAVFDTSSEGIMVTDMENRIVTVNPAFTQITGYQPEEVLGKRPSLLSSGYQGSDFYHDMWLRLQAGKRWEGEIWNRRKNGEIYPEWLSITTVRDANDVVRQHVAVFSDITKRKQDEEKIRWQANYDPLTHLPNRALFSDRLDQALANSRRESWFCALLFIDLDRFKAVNDTLGHPAGDQLLVQVAERLLASVRENDTVARLGGDEFTLILQDVASQAAAAAVAEQIITEIGRPFEVDGNEVFIGATVGLALYPGDAENAEEMLRNADLAMYQAKQSGRNCYHFYTESMNEEILLRSRLEADLHRAIERDELDAWYQPIVHTQSGQVYGAEALLRWHHPERGLLMPGEFIPLAEESGLIGKLGEWVLERACCDAAAWRSAGLGELKVSVNLSSQQRHLGLDSQRLSEILSDCDYPPEGLTLELTEGILLEQSQENINWLNGFKGLGVTLSIDDFGTGYSSLSYLQRFPFDTLKIDKSFVTDLNAQSGDATLVQAMIALAGSFGLQVVAEGVEHKEQHDYLRQLKCGLIQGYLISAALPSAQFVELVRERLPADLTDGAQV